MKSGKSSAKKPAAKKKPDIKSTRKKYLITGIVLLIIGVVFTFVLAGYHFLGFAFFAAALVAFILFASSFLHEKNEEAETTIKKILFFVVFTFCLILAITEVIIISDNKTTAAGEPYAVVLGAGVNGETPSHILEYRINAAAEYLEKCLYLCPGCNRTGTLTSRGNRLSCSCGFQVRYTETGFFEPASPFPTLAEWEDWQKEQLRRRSFRRASEDGLLFSDAGVSLAKIDEKNRALPVSEKTEIRQYEDRLTCAGRVFPLHAIQDMAMTQADRLLFSSGEGYYEIHCSGRTNLRKYLEIWTGKA